jgi:hypothetical protein
MHEGCQSISEYELLREREVVRDEIRRGGRSAEARIPELMLAAISPGRQRARLCQEMQSKIRCLPHRTAETVAMFRSPRRREHEQNAKRNESGPVTSR